MLRGALRGCPASFDRRQDRHQRQCGGAGPQHRPAQRAPAALPNEATPRPFDVRLVPGEIELPGGMGDSLHQVRHGRAPLRRRRPAATRSHAACGRCAASPWPANIDIETRPSPASPPRCGATRRPDDPARAAGPARGRRVPAAAGPARWCPRRSGAIVRRHRRRCPESATCAGDAAAAPPAARRPYAATP